MTNVVSFPKTNPKHFSEKEGANRVDMMKYVYIDQVTETVVQTIAHQLAIAGYEILDEPTDFAFLIETVRAVMARCDGAYHPFQDIADNVMLEPDEDGVMEIADEISVKFFQHEDTDEEPSQVPVPADAACVSGQIPALGDLPEQP